MSSHSNSHRIARRWTVAAALAALLAVAPNFADASGRNESDRGIHEGRGPMRDGIGAGRAGHGRTHERRERMRQRMRDATPEQRRRMLRNMRRTMRFLSREEHRLMREEMGSAFLAEEFDGKERPGRLRQGPYPERRRRLHERLRELPPAERRELREKIREMGSLPPDELQTLRERLAEIEGLSEDERRTFGDKAKRWRDMPPEKRERMRAARKRLMALPLEERMRLLERVMDERSAEDPSDEAPE